MCPHFLSMVLCLGSVLFRMYRKSSKTYVHKKIQERVFPFLCSFSPPKLSPRARHPNLSVFSWEMVKGSDGTCRRILVWWSWDRGAEAWCSTCVPCRYTCDWACRCSLLLCLTDTGRALARWWSLGYVLLPPHHFFNVKTVKVGGFGSGMVFHGTADELSLCKGLGGSVGACRMHIIKTHVIIMQSYFLLFLRLRTLGFDLARPQAQAYH